MINNTGICAVVGPLSLRDFEKKPGGQGWQEPLHTRQLQSQWHKFFKQPFLLYWVPNYRQPLRWANGSGAGAGTFQHTEYRLDGKKGNRFSPSSEITRPVAEFLRESSLAPLGMLYSPTCIGFRYR